MHKVKIYKYYIQGNDEGNQLAKMIVDTYLNK